MKKEKPLCACGKHPIEQQFGTCIDCFAKGVVIMDTCIAIQRSHAVTTMLAARPIIEKCVETGWRDEYLV